MESSSEEEAIAAPIMEKIKARKTKAIKK